MVEKNMSLAHVTLSTMLVHVLFSCGKQTTIRNCCILNNGSPLFAILITIYDSYVEGSLSDITTNNVTTESNKIFYAFPNWDSIQVLIK